MKDADLDRRPNRYARWGRGLARRVGHAIEHTSDNARYTRHLLLGNDLQTPAARVREGAAPVVVLHGFLGTRGTMLPMTQAIQADGRPVFNYAIGRFNTGDFASSARRLIAQCRQLCQSLGTPRVDLVGYSMGGLVGLHAIKLLQGERWARSLIMLGAPVRGSWLGLAGLPTLGAVSDSIWQVLPGSKYLRRLREVEAPTDVRICQVHASEDRFCPIAPRLRSVAPEDYQVIRGVHASLIVSARGQSLVTTMLRQTENQTLGYTEQPRQHAGPAGF